MSATVREKPLARKVSEARRIAEATELGKQLGDYRGQKRKPLDVSLKEHIGKFIDNIKATDAIDLIAWAGLTVTIQPLLRAAPEIIEQIQKIPIEVIAVGGFIMPFAFPFWVSALGMKEVLPKEKIKMEDWAYWLLAATVAALIVKFGPALLQTMGGITKIGSLLLS